MTQDQIKEALAKAIYCHEGNLPAPWNNAGDEWESDWARLRDEAMSQAAAVMALVGPKKLVWRGKAYRSAFAICTYVAKEYVIEQRLNSTDFDLWVGPNATKAERFGTLEAAQAAAQAHADAAHWSNTPLGDMIGGVK